jgi:hypothetical protein
VIYIGVNAALFGLSLFGLRQMCSATEWRYVFTTYAIVLGLCFWFGGWYVFQMVFCLVGFLAVAYLPFWGLGKVLTLLERIVRTIRGH